MILEKTITWKQGRWNEILKNDNKHMRKAGYDIVLRRKPVMSILRRYGYCVSGIDAKMKELIEKYPRLSSIKI